MNENELIQKFSGSTPDQCKAIFNLLFILTNRLQTVFDQQIPELTLRQFMLLSTIRPLQKPLSLGECGNLLGCSRQNVKKLALSLEQKGFVTIQSNPDRPRSLMILPTEKADQFFEGEFAPYREQLNELFASLKEEEIQTLFSLVVNLLSGVEVFEQKTKGKVE